MGSPARNALGLVSGGGEGHEGAQRRVQEPAEPDTFAATMLADAIHSIIPVASADQWQAMRAERKDAHFKKMDSNSDGSISRAEFDAAWEHGGLFIPVWHPFLSGRLARCCAIAEFIEYMLNELLIFLRHFKALAILQRFGVCQRFADCFAFRLSISQRFSPMSEMCMNSEPTCPV